MKRMINRRLISLFLILLDYFGFGGFEEVVREGEVLVVYVKYY